MLCELENDGINYDLVYALLFNQQEAEPRLFQMAFDTYLKKKVRSVPGWESVLVVVAAIFLSLTRVAALILGKLCDIHGLEDFQSCFK